MRVLAVERLVRRPVVQGCMRSPVAQVDRRVHQFSPKKARQRRISKHAMYDVHDRPACTLIRFDLLGGVQRCKL